MVAKAHRQQIHKGEPGTCQPRPIAMLVDNNTGPCPAQEQEMAVKKNKIQDAKKIEEESHRAGMKGARDSGIPRTPSEVENPDVKGDKGVGTFRNPARPGSGSGEFDASKFGVTVDE